MRLCLRLRINDTQTQTYFERVFERFPIRIGRNALNDLRIEAPFVSQFHCVLELHGNSLLLRDLGSKNGTLLRATGMVPANQPIDLAQSNYEFAISSLLFQAFAEYMNEPAPRSRGRLRVGATTDVDELDPLANTGRTMLMPEGALADPSAPIAQRVRPLYAKYRQAWAEVERAISAGAASSSAPERTAIMKRLAIEFPAVTGEPEFQRLAGDPDGDAALEPQDRESMRQTRAISLRSLQELAASYVPGAPGLQKQEDVVEFINKVKDVLDVFLKCFIPLRDGHKQFESSMEIRKTRRSGAQAVAHAKDPKELGARLLDWRDASDEGPHALESEFADLMIHQVAMMNGVMKGVHSLLAELSPKALEAAHDDPRRRKTSGIQIGPYRYRSLWEMYAERHADLAEEDKETFALIFGPQFVRAYSQFAGEAVGVNPGTGENEGLQSAFPRTQDAVPIPAHGADRRSSANLPQGSPPQGSLPQGNPPPPFVPPRR